MPAQLRLGFFGLYTLPMPTLSVCLNSRNEAANIRRAIASVRGIADQIVLVDTGSTDDTIGIAAAEGAQIGHFPWCDDFSAARNAAIDLARCDWVFWLDADEALLPQSLSELRRCIDTPAALGFYVLRQDLADANDETRYTEMWQLRLFRNRPDLRFMGYCHPHFACPLEQTAVREGRSVVYSSIRMRHWGYTRALRQSKLERGARLMELELRDRPGQLYYQIELGRTLLLLGQARGHAILSDAARTVWGQRESALPPMPLVALLLEYLMLLPREQLPAGFDRPTLRALATRWFPRAIPLLFRMAHEDFVARDFASAASLLQQILRLGATGEYDKAVSFDPSLLSDSTRLNLGVAYVNIGHLERAQQVFEGLRSSETFAVQAQANLDALGRLRAKQRGVHNKLDKQ